MKTSDLASLKFALLKIIFFYIGESCIIVPNCKQFSYHSCVSKTCT